MEKALFKLPWNTKIPYQSIHPKDQSSNELISKSNIKTYHHNNKLSESISPNTIHKKTNPSSLSNHSTYTRTRNRQKILQQRVNKKKLELNSKKQHNNNIKI